MDEKDGHTKAVEQRYPVPCQFLQRSRNKKLTLLRSGLNVDWPLHRQKGHI